MAKLGEANIGGRMVPAWLLDTPSSVLDGGYVSGGNVVVAPLNDDGNADANLITQSGFFRAIVNIPEISGWNYILHINYSSASAIQLGCIVVLTTSNWATRRKIDSVWGPWEWMSPPLQLGIEYRTTERYQGKPVYAKAISLGAGPDSNTKKTVQHGIGNMSHIVDYGGEMYLSTGSSNPISLPGVSVVSDEIYSFGVNYRRFIWTAQTTALTTYTGIGWIKYTKSTD